MTSVFAVYGEQRKEEPCEEFNSIVLEELHFFIIYTCINSTNKTNGHSKPPILAEHFVTSCRLQTVVLSCVKVLSLSILWCQRSCISYIRMTERRQMCIQTHTILWVDKNSIFWSICMCFSCPITVNYLYSWHNNFVIVSAFLTFAWYIK